MSISSMELMRRGIDGIPVTREETLEMYANPLNWKTVMRYDSKDITIGCEWVWQGPIIVGYEAAARALEQMT